MTRPEQRSIECVPGIVVLCAHRVEAELMGELK